MRESQSLIGTAGAGNVELEAVENQGGGQNPRIQGERVSGEFLYDLAIPLLGIYTEKILIEKGTCTPCLWQHYLQ